LSHSINETPQSYLVFLPCLSRSMNERPQSYLSCSFIIQIQNGCIPAVELRVLGRVVARSSKRHTTHSEGNRCLLYTHVHMALVRHTYCTHQRADRSGTAVSGLMQQSAGRRPVQISTHFITNTHIDRGARSQLPFVRVHHLNKHPRTFEQTLESDGHGCFFAASSCPSPKPS
jgi:hypothetical protein